MVRKYCIQQAGLLCLVAVIMILTNMIGYQMPLADSIAGILVLCAIALFGLTVSKFMSRFIKLPSMMYVSLTGLLLACPVSPVKDIIIQVTSRWRSWPLLPHWARLQGFLLERTLRTLLKWGGRWS